MSQETDPLPGFWHFAWLACMQPVTFYHLRRRLAPALGPPLWAAPPRQRRWLLVRLAQMLLLISPMVLLANTAFSVAYNLLNNSLRLALAAFGGVALGLAVVLSAIVGDICAGAVASVAASGAAAGAVIGMRAGAAAGILLGVVVGATSGLGSLGFRWLLVSERAPLAYAFSFAVEVFISTAIAMAMDRVYGLAFGAIAGVAYLATLYRFPIFVLETLVQTAVRSWRALTGRNCLQWTPVLYNEQSYLPLPFLEGHLLADADADPVLTRRVLNACSIAPGQRRIGRKVEARLRARELKRLADSRDFQAIAELRGLWLPGVQGADGALLGFSESGRYLAAAQAAFNPHHQLKHLEGFFTQLNAIENQLRPNRDVFTQPFEEPLEALRGAGQSMREEAENRAAGLILNAFRAGNPLSEEEGPELFRGREAAVREIEEILSDANRSASLQLLAPRRAGKTSLLKMLPRLLPDTVCVFFDLQAHPVASVGAFWRKLTEQALVQAKLDRRAELPKLPDGPPMEAAAAWIEKLDQLPNGRRVLIAIDEFERLEDLFPGSRREFLQLMGLFRATIQHRRGVRLLVSGAAPFDELDGVWDDHFISARQIKLPFLDFATATGLLMQPSPEFPPDAIPEGVARDVYQRTGGQPYLLQVFGSLLVSLLNDEKRKTATVADVQAVESRAIEWAESYFRDMYKSAPEGLGRLARGEAGDLTPAARRWLTQRYLLTSDDRLAIPVFGAWIEHHALV
jgi:hypothetical protein